MADYREDLIKKVFKGWEDRAHLNVVLYKDNFYSLSWITSNDLYLVVGSAYDSKIKEHKVRFRFPVSKESGNQLYTVIKHEEHTSKNGNKYYNMDNVVRYKICDELRDILGKIEMEW